MPDPEEFLLIDLSSVAYPLWHVSQTEEPNATSIKTVARVRSLAASHPRAAVCADSGKSFRAEIDPTYKAQRPAQDATLRHQIDLAIEVLRGEGFPVWAVKGYEADDIIATATARVLAIDGARVLIASADKDLLALLGPRVTAKSTTTGDIVDEAAVMTKFGVRPGQMRDYLTLTGDAADNIVGAKGIGPKKAAEVLRTFPNLEFLYTCIDDRTATFTPSTVAALAELRPRLETVRALVTMKTDVPIPFEEILADRVAREAAAGFAEFTEEDVMDAVPVVAEPKDVIDVEAARFVEETAPKPAAPKAAPDVVTIQTAALTVAPGEWERALEPRSMREAQALAENLFAARLFGAYGNAAGILATVLAGREYGIQAVASLRAFHIIDGKPTLAADLIRALVLKSGKAKYFKCVKRTAESATFKTHRVGDDDPDELTYTIEEGKLAWPKKDDNWLKAFMGSGWGRNPADMCVARASSKLARLVYSDVIHGLVAIEEMD